MNLKYTPTKAYENIRSTRLYRATKCLFILVTTLSLSSIYWLIKLLLWFTFWLWSRLTIYLNILYCHASENKGSVIKGVGAIILLFSWITKYKVYDNWNAKVSSLQTHRIIIEDAIPHSVVFETAGYGFTVEYDSRRSAMEGIGHEFNKDKISILEKQNILSHERKKTIR